MVKFFVLQIRMGKITPERVPGKYRAAVLAALNNNTNDTNDETEE